MSILWFMCKNQVANVCLSMLQFQKAHIIICTFLSWVSEDHFNAHTNRLKSGSVKDDFSFLRTI